MTQYYEWVHFIIFKLNLNSVFLVISTFSLNINLYLRNFQNFYPIKQFRKKIKVHSKNKLLAVKRFLSLLKDFLFDIGMRRNPLTVKGLSFQILSFHCQSISSDLEMKSFVVQRKYNFEDKRKKLYDIT